MGSSNGTKNLKKNNVIKITSAISRILVSNTIQLNKIIKVDF